MWTEVLHWLVIGFGIGFGFALGSWLFGKLSR